MDTTETECIYCGATDLEHAGKIPALADDEAWTEIAEEHRDDCDWIATRAHRRDPTASTSTVCCYEDCDRVATTHDTDGDEACDECAARSERWTEVHEGAVAWVGAENAAAVEAAMRADGWDLSVRAVRRGEIVGTYRHDHHGLTLVDDPPRALVAALETAVLAWAETAVVA